MRVQSTRKIIVEEFPSESQALIRKIATTLNPHLEQVSLALSSNLTLADNFKAQVWPINLKAGASTYSANWTKNERPSSVSIGQILRAGGTAPTTVIAMYWVYSTAVVNNVTSNSISMTFVGLDVATEYNATIIGMI